ncbi:MAG: small subunit ribosomal protein S5 [Phycisphaerales bacterium]|jgi:small subunit ribosomal protein S5
MAEFLDDSQGIESHTVNIYRTAATVKGGRRFSFGALVVIGDRKGKVGFGYGKSNEVPNAIEKSQKYARKSMISVPMAGSTFPHEVEGRFAACRVRLVPASPGTGVVAGGTVRAVLEMAGITDCLTKCYGSTNKLNVVKAVFDAIGQMQTREQIATLRGVDIETTDIEERIKRGQRFAPKMAEDSERMKGPVNTVGQDSRGGRGGRGGGGGGGGRGGRGGGGGGRGGPGRGRPDSAPAAAPAAAPAGDTPAAPAAPSGDAPKS